jgi:hypothetical protein
LDKDTVQETVIIVKDVSKDGLKWVYSNFLIRAFNRICEVDKLAELEEAEIVAKPGPIEDVTNPTDMKDEFNSICRKFLKWVGKAKGTEVKAIRKEIDIEYLHFYEKEFGLDRCRRSFFNLISLTNRHEQEDRETFVDRMIPLFHYVVVVVMVLGVIKFQLWHEKYYIHHMSETLTVGDFTVMLTKLPKGEEHADYNLEMNLRQVFPKDLELDIENPVRDINFAFNVDKYIAKKEEFTGLCSEEYRELLTQKYKRLKEMEGERMETEDSAQLLDTKAGEKKEKVRAEITKMEEEFEMNKMSDMLGIAFVTFESAKYRDKILDRYGKTGIMYKLFGICPSKKERLYLPVRDQYWEVDVERAYEPGDIIWENLEYSDVNRWTRGMIAGCLGYFLICIGLISIYFIKTQKVNIC